MVGRTVDTVEVIGALPVEDFLRVLGRGVLQVISGANICNGMVHLLVTGVKVLLIWYPGPVGVRPVTSLLVMCRNPHDPFVPGPTQSVVPTVVNNVLPTGTMIGFPSGGPGSVNILIPVYDWYE